MLCTLYTLLNMVNVDSCTSCVHYLHTIILFDFSCMVEIEVDNVYNLTLKRNIMKTQKVDRSV